MYFELNVKIRDTLITFRTLRAISLSRLKKKRFLRKAVKYSLLSSPNDLSFFNDGLKVFANASCDALS